MNETSSDYSSVLQRLSALAPLAVLFVYAVGFVVVNSFLSKFNYFEEDILSVTYLKAGLLYSVILLPIFIVIYKNYPSPTDNFKLAWPQYVALAPNVVTYPLWISIFLFNYSKMDVREIAAVMLLICFDLLVFMYTTSALFKEKKQSTKVLINLVIPSIVLIYLATRYTYFAFLYGILLFLCSQFILLLGLHGDKKSSIKEFTLFLLVVLFFSSFFGRYVYGELPRVFGGGLPIQTSIVLNEEGWRTVQAIGLAKSDSSQEYQATLLYSSGDQFVFKVDTVVFVLRKQLINSLVLSGHSILASTVQGLTQQDSTSNARRR